ncbi:ARPP-1 family domain-containing protein [Methanobacterium petrolearium]|uniref:ARPP-1 family domain-containing protein n=1 Tax=Methanobacterium petrolearium TaxID=710190 RepID=UPI0031584708
MDDLLANYIYHLKLGDMQEYNDMSVFPLYSKGDDSLYITLKEALDTDLLTVTEIDGSGSVPELKVVNMANVPVLLLDGEELVGAKQNRVLNTTILLKENSETVIPVSCTEQGRWSYNSLEFKESGNVAAYRVRRTKATSVNTSLKMNGEFRSDQRAVWNRIDDMSRDAGVNSRTRAMSDVYESRIEDLEKYHHLFPVFEDQKGILVMFKGEVMGMDILSSSIAYFVLHWKLLKSYAMEAILTDEDNDDVEAGDAKFNGLDNAKLFLDNVRLSMDEKHKSVGYGCDHRLEGPGVVGSSLTCKDQVIHAAFFSTEDQKKEDMSSYQKRRSFRM